MIPSSRPLKILVADDHALIRDGLVLMIQSTWANAICEIAGDYLGVLEKLSSTRETPPFDAIILDLRMPGMRGVESVAKIAEDAAEAPVIVCTALDDPGLIERLKNTRIHSIVNKTAGAQELLAHLQAAVSVGRTQNQQKRQSFSPAAQSSQIHEGSAMLTKRQREILKLLHSGKPSKVIATELNVSLDTIKSHLSSLYAVMGVKNRSEAIVKSQDWLL
jgi:DNA-binding NarL/FixJ family response regulator